MPDREQRVEHVRLIHWHAEEAQERAGRIRALGYPVEAGVPNGPAFLRALAAHLPAAVVIDLSRLPSQGRDIALLVRKRAGTRHVPLVFVGGVPAKVARIRALLPDAVYTTWDQIGEALPHAIARPPTDPVVHDSAFAAYAGTPLPVKLGIDAASVVGLIDAPPGFVETLGPLPGGAQVRAEAGDDCTLFLWFVRAGETLSDGIARAAALTTHGPLWIAWPKRASRAHTDLTQQQVRETGLAAGLVDYKICAIDETWSGLLFTRRAPGSPHAPLVEEG